MAASFLDIALRNAGRRFRVLPLKGKDAFLKNWPALATTDESTIRTWATQYPEANCGVCGGSDVIILDTDRRSRLQEICGSKWGDWSRTYSVSSGRPDREHFYYLATEEVLAFGNKRCKEAGFDGNIFEIKGRGALVVGEGSIHPDTGGVYSATQDLPLIPFPSGLFSTLKDHWNHQNPTGKREWNLPVHDGEGRDDFLIQQAGRIRNIGASEIVIRAHLADLNSDPAVMADPKSEEDLDRIARSAARYDVPAPEPRVVFGKSEESEETGTDWRDHFHTKDEALNAPPISFLIEGFLQREGVTGVAAPVRERKSLIALNICHALLTGEKLFDQFVVVKKPDRILYLCPEVSLGPFTDRVKKIGLIDYVGERFFYRTMSSEGHLTLADAALQEALPGSVVILDTAIRFLEGDENSSAHVRAFADSIFALLRNGAEAVILLHHSPKDSGDTMTLENAMRGSGDLGAFLASCWGTRLQDPNNPYESVSFLSNLKQRDFSATDFEVTCGPDCRMQIVGGALRVPSLSPRKTRANKDGREAEALEFLRVNPKLSVRLTSQALKEAGIRRSKDWVQEKRYELMQANGGQLSGSGD